MKFVALCFTHLGGWQLQNLILWCECDSLWVNWTFVVISNVIVSAKFVNVLQCECLVCWLWIRVTYLSTLIRIYPCNWSFQRVRWWLYFEPLNSLEKYMFPIIPAPFPMFLPIFVSVLPIVLYYDIVCILFVFQIIPSTK